MTRFAPSLNRFIVLAVFPAVLALSGCAKKEEGKVLARFDGMTITEKDFIQKLESLPRQLRAVALRNKQRFLEDMAGERYLLREAEKRKVGQDPEVQGVLEAARRKILVARLVETEVDRKIELEPDEASAYYEAHKEDFTTPEMFRVSHILVKTEEEALQVKSELQAGADFEETARKRSIDTTAIRGGDLGFAPRGQFVPEFEQYAFGLKKGELSGPLHSRMGWHVLKLVDHAEPVQRDFDAVRPMIEERLLNEKRSTAFHSLLDRLKGGAAIKVDEKALESIGAPSPEAQPEPTPAPEAPARPAGAQR